MKKQQKIQLRKLIRQRKGQYSAFTLRHLSETILWRLEEDETFQASRTIMLYYSMDDEVYTHQFIKKWSKSKTILLPVVSGDELELRIYTHDDNLTPGSFGILEPTGEHFTDYQSIDLAVIPGMAFDRSGNRLGRGKGYYDRLLPMINATKIGICFPFQLLDYVPVESYDIIMDRVITY